MSNRYSLVDINPVFHHKGLVAFASVVYDGKFYLGNIAIYKQLDGSSYRLVFPDRKVGSGKKIPLFHPVNLEATREITDVIIKEYRRLEDRVLDSKLRRE